MYQVQAETKVWAEIDALRNVWNFRRFPLVTSTTNHLPSVSEFISQQNSYRMAVFYCMGKGDGEKGESTATSFSLPKHWINPIDLSNA